ncbi:hypothetical protein C8R42DRAFT_206403 [Lentinula raphanica]|nr:hypothetical protein C8R42DRAFT_206403 [Lentinula raphanica]
MKIKLFSRTHTILVGLMTCGDIFGLGTKIQIPKYGAFTETTGEKDGGNPLMILQGQSDSATREVLEFHLDHPKRRKLPKLNLRLDPAKFGSPGIVAALRADEGARDKYPEESKHIEYVKESILNELKHIESLQTVTKITIGDPQAYIRAVLTFLQQMGLISIADSDLRKNWRRPLRYLIETFTVDSKHRPSKSTMPSTSIAGAKRPHESAGTGSQSLSTPDPKRLKAPVISASSRKEPPSSGSHGESSNLGPFATETKGQPLALSGEEHSTTVPPSSQSGPDTLDPNGKSHAQSRTGKLWDFEDILS